MLVRGLIYLIAAQALFVVSGLAVNLGLARIFGPADFGTFSVVVSILTWVRLFVVSGVPVALQKFVAAETEQAEAIRRRTLRIQVGYSLAVTAVFFLLSSHLAVLFRDPTLSFFFRIVSADIVLFGLYRFFVGYHNGLHRFEKQALVVGTYALGKIVFVLGLVLSGLSLAGAFVGYAAASLAACALGAGFSRNGASDDKYDVKPLVRFAVPSVIYSVLINLYYSLDLWTVRYFLGDTASGFYGAAGTIAKLPKFIFFALIAILLPTVSRSIAKGDHAQVRRYIRQAIRFILIFLLPFAVLIVSTSEEVVTLLYADAYAEASGPLAILTLGILLYTLFSVMNTVIMADGRMGLLLGMTVILVISELILAVVLVDVWGMAGPAAAMAGVSGLGAASGCFIVGRRFGALIPWSALMKYAAAAAVLYAISSVLPVSGGLLPVFYVSMFGVYALMLFLMKELGPEDLDLFRNALKRKTEGGDTSS